MILVALFVRVERFLFFPPRLSRDGGGVCLPTEHRPQLVEVSVNDLGFRLEHDQSSERDRVPDHPVARKKKETPAASVPSLCCHVPKHGREKNRTG